MSALLVWLVQIAQAPAAHGPEPGPRAALAGLAGFESVSKLDFGERQNRLTAVYLFPDRVRWHFESYGAKQRSEHQYFYRAGELVHELVSGAKASRALDGAERDVVLLQMELRRAVMLWPDGMAWEERPDGSRSATVWADTCCREKPLGTLAATLAHGRVRRVEARDSNGRVLEALEVRGWQERGGRTWPETLALESGGASIVETVEALETRVHYLELSFSPPDRRPLVAPSGPGPSVTARDLVAMTYAVHALPEGTGWDDAVARARAWIAETGARLAGRGLVVDPVPTFELSGKGAPTACLVRLLAPVVPAPEGFESHAERAGLFLVVSELAAVDAALVARLLHALPAGARPGTPYLRVHASPNPVEIVLPLVPGG